MDQYPFEFSFFVAGKDVDLFIAALEEYGFTNQAKVVESQFKNQLGTLSICKKDDKS